MKKLDRIEKLYGNALMNRMRARRGDTIYHCVFCRLQFYDPRKPGGTAPQAIDGQSETQAPQDKSEPEPARASAVPAIAVPAPVVPVSAPTAVAPKAAAAAQAAPAPGAPMPAAPTPAAPAPGAPVPGAHVNGHGPPRPAAGTNLASGIAIRGSIQAREDIYIDCSFDGTVLATDHRVVVGPNARLKATLRAGDVEVRGTLHGNSHAVRKMLLRSGARVTGDIKAGDIAIDDGARLKGSVELVREQPRLPLG